MPSKKKGPRRKRYRRQKRYDGNWTAEMDSLLLSMYKACVVCGRTEDLTRDHVKPLARGNGLSPGNVVILCQSCNSSKCSKPLKELPEDTADKITKAAEEFLSAWKLQAGDNDGSEHIGT